ncbi:WD repeat-containing protein on Y chromosome-like [Tachyglossus aculeatus]|uniref:WD repeat-containing protein on Y chromosome-like n=1 Tax=Tachyglossus aculeatus TaxID=9261 RepID=UPI0018F40489|nr:WD repeat-containing protein on Y chromosome-like [Tachyglossus aculeatus]
MNEKKQTRSSSALGRLEVCDVKSIPNVGTAPEALRAQSCPAGSRSQPTEEWNPAHPEWLSQEFPRGPRSPSHSVIQSINGRAPEITPRPNVDPARSLQRGKIEEQITLGDLQKLNAAFQEFEKRGIRRLDMKTFKCVMRESVRTQNQSEGQIEEFFMKIDYTAAGKIGWDNLCTYLLLAWADQDSSVERWKEVPLSLPALTLGWSHREPILRVSSLADDTLIMVREDGAFYSWSPQLKLRRRKLLFEKPVNRKPKWVTDFSIMQQYNKLIIGTGDREIQLFELSSLEPYCQIRSLESVPLKLDYCYTGPDECLILNGDDQGCVNILVLASTGELLRTWKKLPKVENMPSISLGRAARSPSVTYIRWKVHGDWVTQLNYYESMNAVISASNHEPTALVIGCTVGATNVEQQMKEIRDFRKDAKARRAPAGLRVVPQRRAQGDQTVFQIRKGVKAFSFCKRNNVLLTGGMDRIIRIWNPYLPGKPTGILKSHAAPIFFLHISTEDKKIFSVSTDTTVKIWDLEDHSCLFTACSKTSGVTGELAACHYLPGIRALCVATDALALLPLRFSPPPPPSPPPEPRGEVSHTEPVACCKYNKAFRHVVTCSEGSVVKVWDLETGKLLSEFNRAHGDAEITCLAFDWSGRRLVTGGRDGCLKIWNYNNGHCLHTLKQGGPGDEVCDCTYVEVNQNRYIIAVGWDRRINMYFDSPEDVYHFRTPQPPWPDDLTRGHKEDILCVAHCPPTLLATSSYDGEIIVWNVVSGHMCHRLNSPTPWAGGGEDRSISQVIFLKARAAKSDPAAASLVSNGPRGAVSFWSPCCGVRPLASFVPSKEGCQVNGLAASADAALLFSADHAGLVHVHGIRHYALWGPTQKPPKLVQSWQAHVGPVTALELIEDEKALLTSSADCTVRFWSLGGECIGTFGQTAPWDLSTRASWTHPRELLMAPAGLPTLSPLGEAGAALPTLPTLPPAQDGVSPDPSVPESERVCDPTFPEEPLTDAESGRDNSHKVRGRRWQHARALNSTSHLCPREAQTYRPLQCHEVAPVPGLGQRPDLSVIGADCFSDYLQGRKEQRAAPQGRADGLSLLGSGRKL